MLRNIKYVFATIPLIQYTDYKKCDYDALKMIQDKEYVAKIIKINPSAYSQVLSCSKRQTFELLVNSKTKTIKQLYKCILDLEDSKDIDIPNIICEHVKNTKEFGVFDMDYVEKLIELYPVIKNDERLYVYLENYIHNCGASGFRWNTTIQEYIYNKCSTLIINNELEKMHSIIHYLRSDYVVKLINENMELFNIDYVVKTLGLKQPEINDFLNYNFKKTKDKHR